MYGPHRRRPVQLKGEVALVTGASRGIGRAIAEALGRKGAKVAVGFVSRQEEARAVVNAINDAGGQAVQVRGDVGDAEQVENMLRTVEAFLGPVTVLVNNAGHSHFKNVPDITPEDFDRELATNLKGAFLLAQRVAPGMRGLGKGRIINIGSSVGLTGVSDGMDYVAAKAGIVGLTKGLAKDLAPHITVNCVVPGITDTDMARELGAALGEARVRWAVERRALKRMGTPADIAEAVLFLLEDGDFMTGQLLVVDGGRVML